WDCASPLALSISTRTPNRHPKPTHVIPVRTKSARGLAQSKTWRGGSAMREPHAKCVVMTHKRARECSRAEETEAGISHAHTPCWFGQTPVCASGCAGEGTGVPSKAQFPRGGLFCKPNL